MQLALKARFQSFVRNAVPDTTGRLRILSRQVYILPTRFGFLYAVMLLAMLLGSSNYGSNPGFLLTFLLAGIAMAALFQTWKNLCGLELSTGIAEPVFCGNDASLNIQLQHTDASPRCGIEVYADGNMPKQPGLIDLTAEDQSTIRIALPTNRRGWMRSVKVVVASRYPLGLFRAWAYAVADIQCLVYPVPASHAAGASAGRDKTGISEALDKGDEDFVGHRRYQDGDNITHIDWKALARARGTLTKHFAAPANEQVWLRWDSQAEAETEQRISALTRAVLDLDASSFSYGLELPGRSIEPSQGAAHRHRCLQELALLPRG